MSFSLGQIANALTVRDTSVSYADGVFLEGKDGLLDLVDIIGMIDAPEESQPEEVPEKDIVDEFEVDGETIKIVVNREDVIARNDDEKFIYDELRVSHEAFTGSFDTESLGERVVELNAQSNGLSSHLHATGLEPIFRDKMEELDGIKLDIDISATLENIREKGFDKGEGKIDPFKAFITSDGKTFGRALEEKEELADSIGKASTLTTQAKAVLEENAKGEAETSLVDANVSQSKGFELG